MWYVREGSFMRKEEPDCLVKLANISNVSFMPTLSHLLNWYCFVLELFTSWPPSVGEITMLQPPQCVQKDENILHFRNGFQIKNTEICLKMSPVNISPKWAPLPEIIMLSLQLVSVKMCLTFWCKNRACDSSMFYMHYILKQTKQFCLLAGENWEIRQSIELVLATWILPSYLATKSN